MPSKKRHLQHVPISTFTVARIHQVVRRAPNLNTAAMQLGVGDVTLGCHLSKFILDGNILNFAMLKQMTIERARLLWGAEYENPMCAPTIDIRHYTGAHIHEIACRVKNIREAATQLAVRDHTLARYLRQFIYNGKRLTFRVFQILTDEEARDVLGACYKPSIPSQRRNLTPDICIDKHAPDFDTVASDISAYFHSDSDSVNEGLDLYGFFSSPFTTTVDEEPSHKRYRTDQDAFLELLKMD